MKKLVIFGLSEIAELANYYFSKDSNYVVVGFTVDGGYKTTELFMGKPVVPFEHIQDVFPPDQYDIFIALSYKDMNELRKSKYDEAKRLGYTLASYVSSYSTVLNDGQIGDNCFILEDNTIQPSVKIGSNVTLWSGNHIGHHSIIKNHVFISSHVVISGGVTVEECCFIGVNATLRDHIVIGKNTLIGAGAIIMKSTDPFSVLSPKPTEIRDIRSDQIRKI
jgi:sugar O-acyltransferase (sialic acid O-acetyltransferase NeuD family)